VTGQPHDAATSPIPDDDHRWRCGACGNLTRFDVVRSARTREFWHLDLAGAASVDIEETLSTDVLSVTCRWCGRGDQITVVTRPGRESP
jgi:RNase P subunit RPR2